MSEGRKYLPPTKTMRDLAWALNQHIGVGRAAQIADYDMPHSGTWQDLANNLMGVDRGCWTVSKSFDERKVTFRRFDGWDELRRRQPCDLPERAP